MPVGTIITAKELEQTYQPLLLATFEFVNGTVLRVSSHPLNVAEGGVQYGGNNYLARVLDENVAAIQAMSEQGIDVIPSVDLTLADADRYLWTNYEVGIGFKGARLTLTFVFWNADTSEFSSDSLTTFVGKCGPGQAESAEILSVSATSILNLQRVELPDIRIQKRCPWIFPLNADQRQEAADDEDSFFYPCGYSPDASGANARGNLNGDEPYTECSYTKADCVLRGMFKEDSLARKTGRFGGIQFDPPRSWKSKSYLEGRTIDGYNTPNEAKFGDYVPLVYGMAWVEARVMSVMGDGNSSRFECVVCAGKVENIFKVIVNDVEVPQAADMNGNPYLVHDVLFWWAVLNRGDRDGQPTEDAYYNGKGDPYGSMCSIMVVVPRSLQASNSVPRVSVLVRGPHLRTYNAGLEPVREWTQNPAWVLMDILVRCGWYYDDLDIQSFYDASLVCAASVSYVQMNGYTYVHERFAVGFVISDRRSAAEIVRGIRTGCRGLLIPNVAGKVALRIQQSIAAEQPAQIPGSNYATAVNGGYVAYKFDLSTILRKNDGAPAIRVWQPGISDCPNRMSVNFQDSDNGWAPDSLTIVDTQDVPRSGQEVGGSVAAEGLNSYDQSKRVIASIFAEGYRGNPRSDTGGTIWMEVESSVRIIHLRGGHLCLVDLPHLGISSVIFRVMRVQPGANFETSKATLRWHADAWYSDTYGQHPDPEYSEPRRNRLSRPAYPWQPYTEQPGAQDPLHSSSQWNFRLEPIQETSADGSLAVVLRVTGKPPVNMFSTVAPPFVPLQGNTASSGGAIPGGRTYWMALVAKDATGASGFKSSAPSQLVKVDVGSATDTNTISITGIAWPSGAAGYLILAGDNPNALTFQGMSDTTPASVTLTSLNERSFGLPDLEFDRLTVRLKLLHHAGVWGQGLDDWTANTITIGGAGWTVNEWAGRIVSIIGRPYSQDPQKILNYLVAGNTDETLLLQDADLLADDIAGGEAVIMRTKATSFGPSLIGDAKFDNTLSELLGDTLDITAATNPGIIQITTAEAHGFSSGNRVFVSGCLGNTAANGFWQIMVIDETRFMLLNSVANGDYTGGGRVQRQQQGLNPDDEIGRMVRIISGKGAGQQKKIKSATPEGEFEIEGTWSIEPDATSIFVVEDADWREEVHSSTIDNHTSPNDSEVDSAISLNVPANSYLHRTVLVEAIAVDGGGNEALAHLSPYREIYLFGVPGSFVRDYYLEILLVEDPLEEGEDVVSNRGRIRLDAYTQVAIDEVAITAKEAPSDGDFVADILTSQDGSVWTSIFPDGEDNKAVLPEGAIIAEITAFRTGALLNNDRLRVDVLQGGSALGVTIEVKGKVVTTS